LAKKVRILFDKASPFLDTSEYPPIRRSSTSEKRSEKLKLLPFQDV